MDVPNGWNCPLYFPNPIPVELRATNDTVLSQELISVTLKNGGSPVTSLTVELVLPSGNYTQSFASVSDSAPLGNGQEVTQTAILPLVAMRTWTSYEMIETGSLQGRESFSWSLSVQLEG